MKTWPGSTGLAGWEALRQIERLLSVARAAEVPVIHMTGLAKDESGMPGWGARLGGRHESRPTTPEELDRHERQLDIVGQAAPVPGEVVLKKTAPSAFFAAANSIIVVGNVPSNF